MRSNRLFIFYEPGTYGSWLEWMIQRCHREFHVFTSESPLQSDGSSHQHTRLFDHDIAHPQGHQSILKSLEYHDDGIPFLTFRAIPKTNENEDASMIMNHASEHVCCIYIAVSDDRMRDLVSLNMDKKVKSFIDQLGDSSNIKKWNIDATSIDDLHTWETREYISLYYHDMIKAMTEIHGSLDSKILTIDVSEILDENVEALITKIFNRFQLPLAQEKIESVKTEHARMLSLQDSLRELTLIDQTVDACIAGEDVSIPELSLLAQAIIQKRLRDLGHEIRCYGLNKFPTSTAELYKLLVL